MDPNRTVRSPAAPIRLLIIDEHPVVGEGIRATLGAEPDNHVETVTDLGSATAPLATRRHDIVLAEVRSPGNRPPSPSDPEVVREPDFMLGAQRALDLYVS
jgi:DNA-binding NarL/FixJ family response regulator